MNAFLEACNNYTCPPEHSVPSGDVIVKTVTDTLAVTGGGNLSGLITLAVFLVVGSGALFAYNELRKRERREEGWEYGTEYEVSSTESVFEAAENEAEARKQVEQSPYDTGIVRRRIGTDFWVPFN